MGDYRERDRVRLTLYPEELLDGYVLDIYRSKPPAHRAEFMKRLLDAGAALLLNQELLRQRKERRGARLARATVVRSPSRTQNKVAPQQIETAAMPQRELEAGRAPLSEASEPADKDAGMMGAGATSAQETGLGTWARNFKAGRGA